MAMNYNPVIFEMPTVKSALLALALALATAGQSAHAVDAPLGFDDARHLLNRTSFAANMSDIEAFARLTRTEAVERLLAWTRQPALTPPPRWTGEPFESPRLARTMNAEDRKRFQREQFEKGVALRAWWLQQMLTTPSPLTEKMTLFWHNHFVSSQRKVRSPQLMYRQNVLLRQYALGNFGELLHAVSKDPAMVIYLDSASNRKQQPNENFAREVMELFTLGEGHYSEHDVKEAARAFTGWSLNRDTGEFVFRRFQHDDGMKTVLGVSGRFDGDAVLDILLAQPQTAEFIVAKLWREFVSPVPDVQQVGRIASVFRDSHYDIKAALRALLTSDAFYAPQNRAALIKSPVDLVVGTLRQFRFTMGEPLPFVFTVNQLGQNLFAPPNVKGWPGGDSWIDSSTLLARKAFLDRLFRAEEMRPAMTAMAAVAADRVQPTPQRPDDANKPGEERRARLMRAMADVHFDKNKWLFQFNNSDKDAMQRVLLASVPVSPPQPGIRGLELIRYLTQDPAYQLK